MKEQYLELMIARRLTLARKADTAEIDRKIENIKRRASQLDSKPVEVKDATSYIKNNRAKLFDMNRLVFAATDNLSAYSALFRYAKQKSPAEWRKFADRVRYIGVQPIVLTPTEWPKQRIGGR